MNRSLLSALMLSTALFVAGCESAEEKAEGYYQSALSLLEEGDVDRALIELRNVFEYDGFHLEARELYADTLYDRGEIAEAYSQYLRLVEQYPDTPDIRVTLAEIAINRNDWEEAERHGGEAVRLAPDNVEARAISSALDYRTATLNDDDEGLADALNRAKAVLEEAPDNLIARRILITGLLAGRTPSAALPELEIALEQHPDLLEFHVAKFRIHVADGQDELAQAQLEEMFAQFPDNRDVRGTLVQWYMTQGDVAATETLLRDLAGELTAEPDGHVTVVQFLQENQSIEAAQAELDRLVEANEGTANAELYQAMQASILYTEGDDDAAITTLQDIIEGAEPSDQTRRIKLTLARMLSGSNDLVGARALVEEILAEDSANVEALKVRAAWRISDDQPEGALTDLRVALDQAPRDPEILMLMAQAHQRAGQGGLAGERLALAVEASDAGVTESLTYARFLNADGQSQAAQTVLTEARGKNPGNLEILGALADMLITDEDWNSVAGIIQTLESINTEEAVDMATALEASVLLGQNRTDESIQFLQDNLATGDNPASATVTIVLTQLRSGRTEDARTYLDEALAATPDDPSLRLLDASMLGMEGDLPAAEARYRGIIEEFPNAEAPVRLLFTLLQSEGRQDEATDVLNAGIDAVGDPTQLLWIKASLLESEGDVEGSIAIYEDLYQRNTNDVVVANNLASLIATYRDDDESLDRAFNIARRLRGMAVPAFQDTYGWIESRRGNHEEAVSPLEAAASGLPNDPLVHYHLGMTYAALERQDEAIESLTRALELAGDSISFPRDVVNQTLEELNTAE